MTKKNFEAPYLKVVEVKNDIITGSDTINAGYGSNVTGTSGMLAPGRRDMWNDGTFDDEYDY